MIQDFSFKSLNLTGVKAAAASAVLAPGDYVCKVGKAEITDTKANDGKILVVQLRDTKDGGVITDRINVANKSEQATQIGLEQLRALLEHGGHPDPDNIGTHGVSSIVGLTVGVKVGTEMYQGEKRSKVKGYMKPEVVKGYEQTGRASDGPALGAGGDLPF